MDAPEFWERERAAAALAGLCICPEHGVPCWICSVVSDMIAIVREATNGHFPRAAALYWDSVTPDDPNVVCHHWLQEFWRLEQGRSP